MSEKHPLSPRPQPCPPPFTSSLPLLVPAVGGVAVLAPFQQLPPKLPLADASTAFNPGTAKEEKRRRKRANKRQRDAQTEYSAASSLIGDLPPVPSEGSIPAAPPSQRTLNGQRRIMQQNHTILSLGSFEDGLDFGVAVEKTGMSEELLKERWNSLLFTQYHFPGPRLDPLAEEIGPRTNPNHDPWTPEEEAVLLALPWPEEYHLSQDPSDWHQLHISLGTSRTQECIANRVKAIAVSRRAEQWTLEETSTLLQLTSWDGPNDWHALRKLLLRPASELRRRHKTLSLEHHFVHGLLPTPTSDFIGPRVSPDTAPWTEQEDAALLAHRPPDTSLLAHVIQAAGTVKTTRTLRAFTKRYHQLARRPDEQTAQSIADASLPNVQLKAASMDSSTPSPSFPRDEALQVEITTVSSTSNRRSATPPPRASSTSTVHEESEDWWPTISLSTEEHAAALACVWPFSFPLLRSASTSSVSTGGSDLAKSTEADSSSPSPESSKREAIALEDGVEQRATKRARVEESTMCEA